MFRQIGPMEIVLILLVLVLLFGAKKLPELARGTGRALRIFKSETKGLIDDDEEEQTTVRRPAAAPRQAELPTQPDVNVVKPTQTTDYDKRPDVG